MSARNLKLAVSLEVRVERCLRDFDSTVAKELLREALEHLRQENRGEPAFAVHAIHEVSRSNPSEWEGELEDDEEFFVRYRRGKLCAFVDDCLVEILEPDLSDPDKIEFERMKGLLSHLFVFPAVDFSVVKP